MRKSFTQLFSVLMLICVFGFQASTFAADSWDRDNSIPMDEDINVNPADIATQFVVAFDDVPAITAAGGTMAVYKEGTLLKVIPINNSSSAVEIVDETIVVTHGIASFDDETWYSIQLTAGTVTVGEDEVPVEIDGNWEFQIGDYTAPQLVDEDPLDPVGDNCEANMFSNDFELTLVFDEDVAIGEGTIAIYQEDGTVVELIDVQNLVGNQNVVVDNVDGIGTVTVTVNDEARFVEEMAYFVRVAPGAFVDVVAMYGEDAEPNAFAGIADNDTWAFTTRVNSAPAITASVTDITGTTATLNVTLDADGGFYYLLQLESVAAPTDMTGFSALVEAEAGTAEEVDLTGLTGLVDYEVYIVSENDEDPINQSSVAGKKVEFTTLDNYAPIAEERGTIANDEGVTTGAWIGFDEEVVAGEGTLYVRKSENNALAATLDASVVTSTEIDNDDDPADGLWKVVFDFGVELESATDYYIVFPNGFITDVLGNEYADDVVDGYDVPDDDGEWEITSADFEAPVVTFSTDTKDTPTTSDITGAGNDDYLYIHFDEDVVPATLFAEGDEDEDWDDLNDEDDSPRWTEYITLEKDGKLLRFECEYDEDDNEFEIELQEMGSSVWSSYDAEFESNTTYTLTLKANVVEDLDGNVIETEHSINITTGDNNDAEYNFGPSSSLDATTALTIEFEKDVFVADEEGEIDHALETADLADILTLEINEGDGMEEVDDFTAEYDPATMTITVTPVEPWPTSVCDDLTVNVMLTIDDSELIDSYEEAFSGDGSETWVVEDYEAPEVTLLSGDIESTDMVTDNATIEFSELVGLPVDYPGQDGFLTMFTLKLGSAEGENLPFTVSPEENGHDLYTLTPEGWTWDTDETYYYGVGEIFADCDNNYAPATFGTFTVVGDAVDPTVEALTYTVNDGAAADIDDVTEGVEADSDNSNLVTVKVQFNINVDDADLTVPVSVVFEGDEVVAPIAITVESDDIDGDVLTLVFDGTVLPEDSTQITVTIPAGLVEGNATYDGTNYAQLEDDVVISLISADGKAPVILGQTPVAASTVAMDLDEGEMTIDFDEPVALGSGSITFTETGETTAEQSVTVSAANIEVDEDGMSAVVSVDDLELYNTEYTVVVVAEAFVDEAGNDLGADQSWVYTTDVNTPPAVDELSPADYSDLVPLTLDLQITFDEDVVQASVAGSRKLIYVIEKVGEEADQIINGEGDLVNETEDADDIMVYFTYVEDTDNVKVDGNLVTITGVVLEEDKEYYVLITPGAFKDLAEPDTEVAEYVGITAYNGDEGDAWDFKTGDVVNAEASLDFTIFGLDKDEDDGTYYGVATDSDIELVFSKPVAKADGTEITDEEIPLLVQLYKGSVDPDNEIEFTGTISADKKTITIDNSSLVILGEMVGSTQYWVRFESAVLESAGNETDLAAWELDFWTSDYDAPAAPAITFDGDEADAVWYGENSDEVDSHIAELILDDDAADAVAIYYLWTTDLDADITAENVKDLGVALSVGNDDDDLVPGGTIDLVFEENMESETEYRVVAVAEDLAGNLSDVEDFTYITDDVVEPALVGDLPTAFSEDEDLQVVFDEDVEPVDDAYARVIDANGVVYMAPLTNLDGDDADANIITIVISAAGLPLSEDIATYTIEIDGGMIVDVPREIETGVFANEPNVYAGLFGSSFAVTTDDETAPELDDFTVDALDEDPIPMEWWFGGVETSGEDFVYVPLNPTFTLTFDEAVELNDNFISFVVYEFDNNYLDWWENIYYGDPTMVMKSAQEMGDAYDVITAENISGEGTSTITITTNRAFVTSKTYYIVINDGTFSDMDGNVWDNGDNLYKNMIGEDTEPLYVSFRAPVYNDEEGDYEMFYLPYDGELPDVPMGENHEDHNFQIKFRKSNGLSGFEGDIECEDYPEGFVIDPEQDVIDVTELYEHVYVKVDGVDIPFSIKIGSYNCPYMSAIKFGVPDIEDYKGQTITYGFVNLYDNHGNLNEGEEVSFVIAEDAEVHYAATFTPGDNDRDSDTEVTIPVDQVFTVAFDSIIYSYNAVAELNNLIVDAEWLETNGAFALSPMPADATLEVLTYEEVDGKSVVTLQVDTDLDSETTYTLSIVDDKIQVGQGTTPLNDQHETYVTGDVTAPELITMYDPEEDEDVIDPDAYLPVNDGIAGKSETLGLVFDEEVEGAGSVEIHLWDGQIVATVDITGVGSDDDATDDEWVIELGDIEDIMADNSTFITNESYYVIIPDTSIVDMSGNAYAGITTINEWSFELQDDTTPIPTFVQNEEMGVSTTTTIDIVFDREVVTDYGWLAVYEEEDGDAVQLIRIEDDFVDDGTSFTFEIDELAENTKYYVELGEGSFVLEADGSTKQEQVNIGEWWFSTEINSAPEVVEFSPAHEEEFTFAVAPGSDLVITFDQEVAAGTGNIQLHNMLTTGDNIISSFDVTDAASVVFDGVTVTIPGDVLGLVENAKYYVIVPEGAIVNTSSTPEAWEGVTTPLAWQFSTPETFVVPELASFTPQDTIADNHPEFVMTFVDNVMFGEAGTLTVTEKDSTEAFLVLDITEDMIVDNVVTVSFDTVATGGLNNNTTYIVNVDAGVLVNEAGNAWEGVADESWTFTTGDSFLTAIDPVVEDVDYNVYPNPFSSYIRIDNYDKLTRVIITNIAGQRVLDIEYPSYEISTGNLVTGVYVVSLITEDGIAKSSRIVKR